MAVITLQPSADIHLVMQPAPRTSLPLDVLSHEATVAAPTSVKSRCTFTIANPTIATVTLTGVITARSVGHTFLTVEFTPVSTPPAPTRVVAKVSVHPSIQDWWFGNNLATVHAGDSDLVLSIYAHFAGLADGNMHDITGHGYVTLTSLGANGSVASDGRVTGNSVGDVTIEGNLDGTVRRVVVTVVPPFTTIRSIVKPVAVTGPINHRRNILFLAEGFKDEAKFNQTVVNIVDRFRNSPMHEPFHILRNDINYWKAFERSRENGITPGPPLGRVTSQVFRIGIPQVRSPTPGNASLYNIIERLGLPNFEMASEQRPQFDARMLAVMPAYNPANLDMNMFDGWQMWGRAGIPQARDSKFGFKYGDRLGERSFTEGPAVVGNLWYIGPWLPRFWSLLPDPRRSPPNLEHWESRFFDFITSLRTAKGPTDPNHVIGPRWGRAGADQGLVVILCNDEAYGAYANPQVYSAVAIDQKDSFTDAGFKVGRIFDHEPDTTGFLMDALVSVVAHELGHQFFLGEEYEGISNGPSALGVSNIEQYDNCTTQVRTFAGFPSVLDVARVKWNRLLRADQVSILAGPAVNAPGGNISVQLEVGEGKDWPPSRVAFLRTRNINPEADIQKYPTFRSHAFHHRMTQVVARTGDVITLDGGPLSSASGEAYPAGSILYHPKPNKAGTDFQRLILPQVATLMAGPPPSPLFPKTPAQCMAPPGPSRLPPTVPGIRLKANDREYLVAVYEGARALNCKVYRPSPSCKMRDHFWPMMPFSGRVRASRHFRYCFVCRYTIVNEVNPKRHPILDALYPGEEA